MNKYINEAGQEFHAFEMKLEHTRDHVTAWLRELGQDIDQFFAKSVPGGMHLIGENGVTTQLKSGMVLVKDEANKLSIVAKADFDAAYKTVEAVETVLTPWTPVDYPVEPKSPAIEAPVKEGEVLTPPVAPEVPDQPVSEEVKPNLFPGKPLEADTNHTDTPVTPTEQTPGN